jgi:hypothetical protein
MYGAYTGFACPAGMKILTASNLRGARHALVRRDLPPGVPGGGGTMRTQWANWKKLSPVFGSKDLIWTDALSCVVVCWRPSSRISPGPLLALVGQGVRPCLHRRCYRYRGDG